MKSLPSQYQDLSPFIQKWAVSTQNERQIARKTATADQMKAFYNAILPQMPDILKAVDSFPLGSLPDDHKTLFELACSLAEVAPHVELYRGSPDVPNSFEEERMTAAHGDKKTWDIKSKG